MSLSPSARVHRSPDSIATEIDGEVVVMSIATGRTFGLDKRASRIWQLLEQPNTADAIVETLVREFDTTAEKCRADVVAFLEDLIAKQLATSEGAAG